MKIAIPAMLLALLMSGCTAAETRAALTALELARKIGCDTLCPADEEP